GSRSEAAEVIERAVAELKAFVDDVARGEPNVPLRLYPTYEALAALQGRRDCAAVELFFPDLTPPAPAHPRPKSLAEGELAPFLHSQRTRWQRGILAWIRRQPAGLEEMRETLDAIHAVAHQLPERRALWWVAGGLVDALLDATEAQRLAQARALWNKLDIYMRDLAANATSAGAFRERAAALPASAAPLGDAPLSKVLGALAAAAARIPHKPAEGSDFLLLEMASAFLLVQSLLEHFEQPLADTAEQVEIMSRWLGEAAPGKASGKAPAGLRPDLTQHVSALQ